MFVNGKQLPLPDTVYLNKFLEKEGYDLQRVAVEKNGIIVPKKKYETEILSDTDKLEIVHFVGGG